MIGGNQALGVQEKGEDGGSSVLAQLVQELLLP